LAIRYVHIDPYNEYNNMSTNMALAVWTQISVNYLVMPSENFSSIHTLTKSMFDCPWYVNTVGKI